MHPRNIRNATATLARVLSIVSTDETIGRLLNDLLCVDAEPRLTDYEVTVAETFFDQLSALRPDAVEAALAE